MQRIPDIPNLDILSERTRASVSDRDVELRGDEPLCSTLRETSIRTCNYRFTSVLSVTDGVILAREMDAVVLVVRHGKSSKHVVRRARDLLLRSGAPITGIVLNAVDLSSPDYYGYYGYSGYSSAGADAESWQAKSDANSSDSREVKR